MSTEKCGWRVKGLLHVLLHVVHVVATYSPHHYWRWVVGIRLQWWKHDPSPILVLQSPSTVCAIQKVMQRNDIPIPITRKQVMSSSNNVPVEQNYIPSWSPGILWLCDLPPSISGQPKKERQKRPTSIQIHGQLPTTRSLVVRYSHFTMFVMNKVQNLWMCMYVTSWYTAEPL